MSYQMVRRYIADRKPQVLVESGKAPIEAFVLQTHQPGMEAEVDFGDMSVRLAGELVTSYLFSFRLSYSGNAVHRVFAPCGQEAFFEGHVHALRALGGVPQSRVRYDNLKAAVARVLGLSRARVETDRCWSSVNPYGTFRLDVDKRLDVGISAGVPRQRRSAEITGTRSTSAL
ncbi:hypothetical protein ACFXKC_57490 [Streptomyces sp. NPDC059340]|uniref:hypothetical protein n=1 Tax=Streptomyces sp. NPDC059340 TaxID=3346806 RepID=UPI0036BBF3C6